MDNATAYLVHTRFIWRRERKELMVIELMNTENTFTKFAANVGTQD